MRRTFPALCLASTLAFAASLSAQQASPNQPARNDGVTTPADYEQTASKTGSTEAMTLTGCLDRANDGTYELRNARASGGGATATSGTSSTTSAGGTTAGATGATAGAAGTTGTTSGATGTTSATGAGRASASEMPSTWTLKSATDLAPHVGHQVQITGKMSASNTSGGSSNTATTSNPTTTTTGARMKDASGNAHSVEVQSVRMVSQSCS